MISIRPERPADIPAIHALNELAFQQPLEATLVDELRQHCHELVSLVATDGDAVVGHILFSPVTVDAPGGPLAGMGLGPMAVLPDRQRQGIGSELVRRGLTRLAEPGCPFVVVLGHPDYYPRFGFEPASRHGLFCAWDGVPDAAFLVVRLDPLTMRGVTGVVRYRPEFDAAV